MARTVTIGSTGYEAVCPVPREGIGFWEAMALTVRGWIDARANRGVPDGAHTHSLHRLQSAHRRREAEAVRRIDEALSAVDRALAPLEVVLAASPGVVPEIPTSADLARLDDAERAQWAARVRSGHAAHAQARADESRRAAAEVEAAVLRSVREALAVEGRDVLRQWREAYAMRAARYTRARFGRRGAALGEAPEVAAYLSHEAPTVNRRAA
ncbi:hypothetical protein [Microbacterium sp. SLBN-146]|uniref:hypothetical protein n=1 Tax=Microbacterium sp. SLBN-146 TaxID=2768457 RepID=UPI001151355A|nr:hypothetical protein [Microbacterium sp. SLBN-146]TQJ30694.1 hypothetical protein FBY39_1151 [Microbacterium sp. SLBN-146]